MADGEDGGPLRWMRSVRVRLTLAAVVVTAFAVVLAGWLVIRSVESTQLGQIHADVDGRAEEVAARLAKGMPPARAVAFEEETDCADPTTVAVSDEAGHFAMNPDPRNAPGTASGAIDVVCKSAGLSTQSQKEAPLPGGKPPVPSTDPFGGAQGYADQPPDDQGGQDDQGGVSAKLKISGDVEIARKTVETRDYGTLTVTAFAPVDEVARSLDAVRRALWVLLPGLVGLVGLVAWWLAGRALRPVEAIRVEAEEIGGSTIHRRLPEPDSDDEIGRLARTMNQMLDRLEESAIKQRQFVADASHELKSPVAAIRTDLEVALHEGDRADWQTVARAVLAEEGRLETLLGDLLVLASDEEARTAVHTSTVDLAQLADGEAARSRRVPVTFDIGDPDASYVVFGNAPRLERVLSNLLDNPARHADTKVRLSLSQEGSRVRVVVDDDGAGIAPIDRERIFERFTRLDSSRARDRGGAGLGLAVVRSIATRHGGYVWADQSPLGGARFTLELPAAPSN